MPVNRARYKKSLERRRRELEEYWGNDKKRVGRKLTPAELHDRDKIIAEDNIRRKVQRKYARSQSQNIANHEIQNNVRVHIHNMIRRHNINRHRYKDDYWQKLANRIPGHYQHWMIRQGNEYRDEIRNAIKNIFKKCYIKKS